MKTLDASGVCHAADAFDLDFQAIAGWGRVSGINLQLLDDRMDLVPNRLQERTIGKLARRDCAWNKYNERLFV